MRENLWISKRILLCIWSLCCLFLKIYRFCRLYEHSNIVAVWIDRVHSHLLSWKRIPITFHNITFLTTLLTLTLQQLIVHCAVKSTTYIHTYVICTDILIKINFKIINETICTDIGNGYRNKTGTENNPRIVLKQLRSKTFRSY